MVAFAVRESRVLWNVEGLEIFDLAYWGIEVSDEVYTAQNLFMFWGAIITLILVSSHRRTPEVLSESHAPKDVEDSPPVISKTTRKGRDKDSDSKNPFELANSEWKVKRVFPKRERKEKC